MFIENMKIKKKVIETIWRSKEHENLPIIGPSDWLSMSAVYCNFVYWTGNILLLLLPFID